MGSDTAHYMEGAELTEKGSFKTMDMRHFDDAMNLGGSAVARR